MASQLGSFYKLEEVGVGSVGSFGSAQPALVQRRCQRSGFGLAVVPLRLVMKLGCLCARSQ